MNQPATTDHAFIDVQGLVKRYGENLAVAGVDLEIASGEIFGILGPNGAGKTTTLEMIEGLRVPDEGDIWVAGFHAVEDNLAVRQAIGVQLQSTTLFDYLTASELLELFAGLYNSDDSPEKIERLLDLVNLQEKRDSRVNEMSGGQQQRLSIALALVNDPKAVFLDEPTTGLDPAARRDLWETIRNIRAAGATVVLTTHYMEEAEVLCDRVAIMDRGQIIAQGSPRGLIRNLLSAATIFANIETGDFSPGQIEAIEGVVEAKIDGTQLEIKSDNAQATLMGLLETAQKQSVRLANLRSSEATLEDVFLTLTGRSYADDPGHHDSEPPEATASKRRLGRR